MFIAFLTLLFAHQVSSAESTKFGPLEFILPMDWSCQTQTQNMICLDATARSAKNAAIVITYKKKSDADTITTYSEQLAKPRSIQDGSTTLLSTPRGVKNIKIMDHSWVEGIHYGSELQKYYTHYFATTTVSLAFLVSVSVEAEAYDTSMPVLYKTIQSIKINSHALESDGEINATATAAQLQNANHFSVFGYQLRRNFLYIGLIVVVLLGLIGYALLMD